MTMFNSLSVCLSVRLVRLSLCLSVCLFLCRQSRRRKNRSTMTVERHKFRMLTIQDGGRIWTETLRTQMLYNLLLGAGTYRLDHRGHTLAYVVNGSSHAHFCWYQQTIGWERWVLPVKRLPVYDGLRNTLTWTPNPDITNMTALGICCCRSNCLELTEWSDA